MSSAGVPEESSTQSVQQLENSVGRAQVWYEEPACRGVQQNGGVPDQWCSDVNGTNRVSMAYPISKAEDANDYKRAFWQRNATAANGY